MRKPVYTHYMLRLSPKDHGKLKKYCKLKSIKMVDFIRDRIHELPEITNKQAEV